MLSKRCMLAPYLELERKRGGKTCWPLRVEEKGEEEKKVGEEWMNDWIADKKTESVKIRERSIKDISMSCSFISGSLSLLQYLKLKTDRQTDIRHRYYKKHQFQHKYQSPTSLLFKSNNKKPFLPKCSLHGGSSGSHCSCICE